jgi:hypothetical protein
MRLAANLPADLAPLDADIDEDAWATLYRTESRPFPPPKSGRSEILVIDTNMVS